ncbi:MAG: hypothetical protein HY742_05745 [Deltaproteobacteria bacterium]|jgi:hypothetical protein|nr:hypothetical protein [Deltaproteobacteria bacterium]
MHIYTQIYEFAASAGAFEGYVYRKTEADSAALSPWIDHLVIAYRHFSPEVREHFQLSLNGTLGRAIVSLLPVLGEEHDLVRKLKTMVSSPLPASADDFQKKKWFEK